MMDFTVNLNLAQKQILALKPLRSLLHSIAIISDRGRGEDRGRRLSQCLFAHITAYQCSGNGTRKVLTMTACASKSTSWLNPDSLAMYLEQTTC